MVQNLGDRCIICYEKALESPLFSQDIGHHPVVGGGRGIIYQVERRHYAAYASLYHGFVRRQVLVHHAYATHIHGVVFLSALHGSVEGKVLEARHDSIGSQYLLCAHVGALVTLCECGTHHAAQVRILSVTLADSSPSGVECNIYHGRVSPVDSCSTGFLCRYFAYLLHRFCIPGAGEGERDREHGLVAVDYVHAHQQRNAQTAVLDGDVLESLDLVESLDVEYAAHVAFCNVATHLGVQGSTGSDVASHHQVELTDFLLQGHLCHQLVDILLHRQDFTFLSCSCNFLLACRCMCDGRNHQRASQQK